MLRRRAREAHGKWDITVLERDLIAQDGSLSWSLLDLLIRAFHPE